MHRLQFWETNDTASLTESFQRGLPEYRSALLAGTYGCSQFVRHEYRSARNITRRRRAWRQQRGKTHERQRRWWLPTASLKVTLWQSERRTEKLCRLFSYQKTLPCSISWLQKSSSADINGTPECISAAKTSAASVVCVISPGKISFAITSLLLSGKI